MTAAGIAAASVIVYLNRLILLLDVLCWDMFAPSQQVVVLGGVEAVLRALGRLTADKLLVYRTMPSAGTD